jgi:DNA polymerase (family 10)
MPKSKYITNKEIVSLLQKMITAYSVKGENRFRIQAYENAAVSVEHATSELKDLWDEGKLEEVPGVGSGIASYLDELFRTGEVKHFNEVLSGLPPSLFVFEKIPGIGPKRALALAEELNIKSEENALERLKKAAEEQKIRELENFGEVLEQELIKGIESLKKGEGKKPRMPLYKADEVADDLISYLLKNKEVLEAHPLGSLRRRLPTVGDIDISVASSDPKEVLDHFFKYEKIRKEVSRGEEALGRAILVSGQQVDIRISSPEKYGSMLQYFTGSKQHNINLRDFALKKGLSLSEYGIKNLKTEKLKTYKKEEDFYNDLGLEWIPPEIREGLDEINAAKEKNLPELIGLKDIKGDLHIHSDFKIEPSHDLGGSSVGEMIKLALEMGYEYLGFSEHNPSVSQHSDKEIIDLLKKKKEYLEEYIYSDENGVKIGVNKLPIRVYNGLEIDIKPDGSLAIPEKGFEFLDFAVVSVHSSFDLNRQKMTDRVIKGLSHPKAKILGHPTGRMIGSREGYELDWDRLFDFCLQSKKVLEIDAWPNRLDLPDFIVREAVKAGVMLVIDSDAHLADQMRLMEYGVSVARRGWAEKKDIINSLPKDRLDDILLK